MFTGLSQINISGFIALIVAVPFLIFTIRNLRLSKASKDWPKVNGMVLNVQDFHANEKFNLEYEYTVHNNTFKNKRIFYSNTAVYRKDLALEFDKKYAKHQIVSVFYNPKKPKQAVLEPGRTDCSFWRIGILGVITLLGGMAVVAPNSSIRLIDALFQLLN